MERERPCYLSIMMMGDHYYQMQLRRTEEET